MLVYRNWLIFVYTKFARKYFFTDSAGALNVSPGMPLALLDKYTTC